MIFGVLLRGERTPAIAFDSSKKLLKRVSERVSSSSEGADDAAAVANALASSSAKWAFALPEDSAFVSWPFVSSMAKIAAETEGEFDAIAPREESKSGEWQPRHALYNHALLPELQSAARHRHAGLSAVLEAAFAAGRVRVVCPAELCSWDAAAGAAFLSCPSTRRELLETTVELARVSVAARSERCALDAREYVPGYVRLMQSGELDRRAQKAKACMAACRLCGRKCGANRAAGMLGYCRTGADLAWVSGAQPHHGEESVLVGRYGSGTIFFTSCNLLCEFCQNDDISHGRQGELVSTRKLADLMLALQNQRFCHNINLVTPSHQLPQILEALCFASREGLHVPLVWNCGGFESLEALALLDGVVDIYMPDFKFWDSSVAERLCGGARNYSEVAQECLKEMHRQVGDLSVDCRSGLALRGLLVRHLVMPNGLAGTAEFVQWLAREISPDTFVNVMAQYRPCFHAKDIEDIARRPTDEEFDQAFLEAFQEGLRLSTD